MPMEELHSNILSENTSTVLRNGTPKPEFRAICDHMIAKIAIQSIKNGSKVKNLRTIIALNNFSYFLKLIFLSGKLELEKFVFLLQLPFVFFLQKNVVE